MDIFDEMDYKGQAIAVPVIKNIFSGRTINNLVQDYSKGGIDIFVTATTKNGEVRTYAIECKDRKPEHTAFQKPFIDKDTGKEVNAGWAMDIPKYNKMLRASLDGYIPLYFNSFSDGTYAIWNAIESPHTYGEYKAGRYTAIPSEKQWKQGAFYEFKNAVLTGYTS